MPVSDRDGFCHVFLLSVIACPVIGFSKSYKIMKSNWRIVCCVGERYVRFANVFRQRIST